MGGLALRVPQDLPESQAFLPPGIQDFWFITRDGLEILLEREVGRAILQSISREEIQSKSKANGLAKTLVCIQALWFIAQCVTRRE